MGQVLSHLIAAWCGLILGLMILPLLDEAKVLWPREIEVREPEPLVQTSRLLKLPPEIRNHIYSYIFGTKYLIKKKENKIRSITHAKRARRHRQLTSPLALFLTCHQIYSETALLPFEMGRFIADTETSAWYFTFSLSSRQCSRLRRLDIVVSDLVDLEIIAKWVAQTEHPKLPDVKFPITWVWRGQTSRKAVHWEKVTLELVTKRLRALCPQLRHLVLRNYRLDMDVLKPGETMVEGVRIETRELASWNAFLSELKQ